MNQLPGGVYKMYNLTLRYLCPAEYVYNHIKPDETAIKIVAGGMLSEYAIFTKLI